MTPRAWPGQPYPLGATWDGQGGNFALFSQHATAAELCLFEKLDPTQEVARIPMRERTDQIFHCYLPDVRPGQLYGYRVHGPYDPQRGFRFNPAQLLIDPYAKAISGTIQTNGTRHRRRRTVAAGRGASGAGSTGAGSSLTAARSARPRAGSDRSCSRPAR